jgi:hypothetical protein
MLDIPGERELVLTNVLFAPKLPALSPGGRKPMSVDGNAHLVAEGQPCRR